MTGLQHFTVALFSADPDSRDMVAKAWGKKGTSTDITLYSIAKPIVQTTVVPETYPQKPLSLAIAAHMADVIVLGVTTAGIDSNVGEMAILADCMQISGVRAVIGESVAGYESYHDQMSKMFSKLNVASYPSMMVDSHGLGELREKIIKTLNSTALPKHSDNESLVIVTDHAFPVQGVGSVILGTVKSGRITKGQKVKIFPGGHIGTVKSIQVNDVNENEAGPGTHVGVALRGILDKNLNRGSVITEVESEVEEKNSIDVLLKPAAFGTPIEKGMKVHLLSGLADSPAVVDEVSTVNDGLQIQLTTEKKVPFHKSLRVTLFDLNSKQRILGSKIMK